MMKLSRNMRWKAVCFSILFLAFLPSLLWGQSAERIKNAYNQYRKTGDENHLRFRLISEMNSPDFPEGGNFLKTQNHPKSVEILIQVLKSYNRYDLLEKIFFTQPQDYFYREKYKGLYYLTLLNNLKIDVLLNSLLTKVEEANQKLSPSTGNPKTAESKEVESLILLEMYFLQEIARKGERELPRWEKQIQDFPFTPPQERKRQIIFNHFYSALKKKEFLKKVYQSLVSKTPFQETEKEEKVEKPIPQPVPQPVKKDTNQDPDHLNSAENFFDLGKESEKTTPQPAGTDSAQKSDLLNSAENFFNLEGSEPEKSPTLKINPINPINRNGIVYSTIDQKTESTFLNLLYQRGYYRNYLHLFKTQIQRFPQDSSEYKKFVDSHQARLSRARLYLKESSGFPNSTSPELQLYRLFYKNDYPRIVAEFQSYQQNDFYLLSLAATGKWETLFRITQNNGTLTQTYQRVALLVRDPDALLEQLQQQPSEKLKSWELDFLNLVEEDLSPKVIAPVFANFLFKRKDLLSQLDPKTPTLYEYGITLQARIFHEAGQPQEVGNLFRKYYNQMQVSALKELLMFLHGIGALSQEPEEGREILFRILTMNPQSPYRFDIENALNSLL